MGEVSIRKGCCAGCPFNYGDPATEMAYNLGCLPSNDEVMRDCAAQGKAWACHIEPNKVCCGFAAASQQSIGLPLLLVGGVHFS